MNNLFRTCALLFLLASCNSLPPLPAMLTPSKLPSQLLEINTERDTTLTLTSGTIITIPADALKAANGKIAQLEVKEALTIEQMLVAGLRTKSNNDITLKQIVPRQKRIGFQPGYPLPTIIIII